MRGTNLGQLAAMAMLSLGVASPGVGSSMIDSYDPAGGPRIKVGVTHFISERPLTKRQKRRLRGKGA